MSVSTKVIVTNEGALTEKYGAPALARIRASFDKLAAADKSRGISTCVVALDSGTDVKAAGGIAPLRSVTDERGTKKAIDAIFKKLVPDYLVIVGASDVVAHQTLTNPFLDHGADGDSDETVASDLPYAC